MSEPAAGGIPKIRTGGLWAAVILLAVLFVSFSPFVFGDKTLLESARGVSSIMPSGAFGGDPISAIYTKTKDPGAPAWQSEPFLEIARKEYQDEKTLPLWNPYQGYGTPFAANMQSQTYYPLTVALSLHHTPRAFNWYVLARLFLAGIGAYFYIRMFVSFVPALAAGITAMFAGYFLLYISMPHLSVEVLLPLLLFSGEHLVRTPRFRNMAWFAGLVFLVMSGGMPESSFLVLAYSYLYLLFRALTDATFRANWITKAKWLFSSTLFGFAFSAILLLPFRQFMRYSFDIHQFVNTGVVMGLLFDQPKKTAFAYVLPFLYGPSWDNNLRNFVGLLSIFLFVVAILSISWVKNENNRMLSLLTCFFGIAAFALVAKRYGSHWVNWTGALPVFNLVLYVKYGEPLVSISVSMLCALGLERLIGWKVSVLKQTLALGVTFALVPLALYAARDSVVAQLRMDNAHAKLTAWTFLVPLGLLVILALLSIIFNSQLVVSRLGYRITQMAFASCILFLLSVEAVGNYFVPTYYFWNTSATVKSDPFAGAPFVSKLKTVAGLDRIFAENDALMPSWPAVFSLFDIRNVDAMYYRKYLPFLQQFFPNRRHQPGDDLYDRFVGAGSYQFTDPLEQRLLQMSSVKYVVTMPENPLSKTIVEEILQQNTGHLAAGHESQISRQVLTVGDQTRISLGEHPPYNRLPYHLKVDAAKQNFHFSYGINPAAFPICGDGVEFIVEARDPSGEITKLYANYVDPRHDVKLRRWIDGSVDLSRYLDKDVDVLLSTNGGPKGDLCADWAVWSDFHFNKPDDVGPFHLIYKKEVNIYEYSHPLPRASVYYNASLRGSENEVLKGLSNPDLNVYETTLLNEAALTASQREWLAAMNAAPVTTIEAARIRSYQSQKVEIEAAPSRRGILVLNDTDFPGWTATVDGKPEKIVTANYMFRGILLEPGRHLVTFRYRPKSIQVGAGISLASLTSFTLFGLSRLRKKRKAKA